MEELTSTVLLDNIVFGEGPRWQRGKLWFSDIWGHKVRTLNKQGSVEVIAEVERPSGLGFLPDGRLLIGSMNLRQLFTVENGSVQAHTDLRPYADRLINDLVVLDDGRIYVDAYFNPPRLGEILLVKPNGKVQAVASGLSAPNGLVVTPDGNTLIVGETSGSRLTAFTIQTDGTLTNQRPFAILDDATPDGICLDAEGAVWIGSAMRNEFLRVKEGGRITHRISTPGKWAVACTLGGSDRKTLFLMTANTVMERFQKGHSQGFIETVHVEIPGAGWP